MGQLLNEHQILVRRQLWEKLFFHIVPVLGACLSLFDMVLLLKYGLKGQTIHKWFFRGSQFTALIIVMLFLKSRNWSVVFFNRVLCFWWIAKTLMEIPHLQTTFFSLGIGIALFFLYTQVKFAFVSGVAITVLLIPVNKWISTLIARATEKMMKQKDERIRRVGELLTIG